MLRTLAAAGAFVVSLDSTVNIAFPAMAAAFAAPPERMRWVIICFVLTYALMSFAGGALGDRWGHGRVFRAGLALSVAAFVLCGAAPTFGWLLAGRVVQGVAGGLVYGTTPALVTLGADAVARGRALGFLNSAIGLAFA
ncbi:MAG: MFS transporter, partial [Candidatus Rokuibacteriota bacterium]